MRTSQYLCTLVCAITTLICGWPAALMAQGAYTDRNIALYQHMVQRQPFDAGAYYRLGDAYMQKARETGDVMYYGLAEKALRKALDIAPHYSQALRHLAQTLYSQHAFAEAAVQAAQAITLNPSDSHAYGVLGDALFEVGQYPQAEEAYRHMLHIQQDLYSYSRMAGFKSLHGEPHGAIADLERAMQTGLAQQLPQESIAWVQWQLGNEYFALGDLATAESQYQQSLETFRHSHRALAGLAHVRAAQQRYEEAIALYRRALTIIPLPDYAAALGDMYRKTNQTDEAAKQYALVEYIGHLNRMNQALYNRELAAFYVDHDLNLSQALDLARQELDIRQDTYAYDLLAWALYKNGRSEEALIAIIKALQQGTQDAKLFFHAGMIYHSLGNITQAKTYLERALARNPHFHLFHADVARRTLADLDTHLVQTVVQEQHHGQ